MGYLENLKLNINLRRLIDRFRVFQFWLNVFFASSLSIYYLVKLLQQYIVIFQHRCRFLYALATVAVNLPSK